MDMAWHGMGWHGLAWHSMAQHVKMKRLRLLSAQRSPPVLEVLFAQYEYFMGQGVSTTRASPENEPIFSCLFVYLAS